MATKLKITRAVNVNPSTKQRGFSARVITNGKAGYEEIVTEACHNTTLHKAEAKVALELCMESAAQMLKQGMIVDLGPIGKLYPSCNSGWHEHAEDLQLSEVRPGLYYRPADDVQGAIRSATLQWAKAEEADAAIDDEPSADDPAAPASGSGTGSGSGTTPASGDDEP